jgi:ATP-dependent DNA helicase RecG
MLLNGCYNYIGRTVYFVQAEELVALVKKIQKFQCEMQITEVKAANKGCPKLLDSLSSFSNQDDGGVIIFGIDEKTDFSVVGIYDAQDLQVQVNNQCKQMEPIVRALFTVCEIEGKTVVSAEIPGVDVSDRPVFYKGVGRIKGSYIRVGESDEPMSEYEIYSFDAFRKRIRDDIRKVDTAKLSLFNELRLKEYLAAVKNERKNLADHVSDNEILELMGVTSDGVPTLAGVLAFSKYPQAYFPQLCITAVVVPGTEMGDTGNDGERFIANQRITGSISEILDEAVDFVRRNSRVKTVIDDNGKRKDKPEFPVKAVREAILNALVHRDYSIHSENIPVRIEMYSDRMEIANSGGLYGKISIDLLGKVHPETRNPALANILELLHVTENRYSGIPTIRTELENAELPAPIFSAKHGEFSVTFKNTIVHAFDDHGHKLTTDDILDFCSIPRTRGELITFTGFSRYYTMSKIMQPLIDSGLIELTIPDKPKSPKQRYVNSDKK